MTKETRNIVIAVAAIAVVAGAYYLGTTSKETAQVSPSPTQEQTAPAPQPTAQQKQEAPKVPSDSLVQDSANGLNCKNIANAAARNNQRADNTVIVTQSNFSKTYNNCYYEVQITYASGGNASTELRVAPNDDWLVQCTSGIYPPPQKFCTAHNTHYPELGGQITEAQYQQIRAQYLAN